MTHGPLTLQAAFAQPSVEQLEVSGARLRFFIPDVGWLTVPEDIRSGGGAVGDVGYRLGHMHHRVLVVPNPEQKDAPVQLVNAADRAVKPSNRGQRLWGVDLSRLRAVCRE
jgi:hypothetical protein